jgi:GNAT superfamily N-acetyltransferase
MTDAAASATAPPDGVTLRWATVADAAAGARLHLACWREAYGPLVDRGLLEAQLADPASWTERWREQIPRVPRLLAERDGELVGFAVAGPGRGDAPPAPLELYAAYVRAACYGTGLGRALVDRVLGAGPAYLWVLEGNDRARRFYETLGFRVDGTRERFAPLDAWDVRMVRPPASGTMQA